MIYMPQIHADLKVALDLVAHSFEFVTGHSAPEIKFSSK